MAGHAAGRRKRGAPISATALEAAYKSKGLSQKRLAIAVGCSTRTIERALKKGCRVDWGTLEKIAKVLDVTPESLSAADPPDFSRGVCQLPPRLLDFTGRTDELDRIMTRLRGEGRAVGVSSTLRGMGGLGKTVTAVEACWEVRDDFPDAQLVVELRGMSEQPLTPVQAMSQIIRDFRPDIGELPEDGKTLERLYQQVLAGKKALILLDDAKDEAHVRSLLTVPPPKKPEDGRIAFVITSRNALALSQQGVESITLGVLPSDEALTLLRGIVGAKGTDAELLRVAELCGFLPLALRVAGDFLQIKEDWTLTQYISALEEERLRWLKIGKGVGEDVEASLRLSSAALVDENVELAERWQLLHIFPGSFDIPAVAGVWRMKAEDLSVHDGLSTLTDRSLLLYDDTVHRYHLHDLMRPIAKNLFGE